MEWKSNRPDTAREEMNETKTTTTTTTTNPLGKSWRIDNVMVVRSMKKTIWARGLWLPIVKRSGQWSSLINAQNWPGQMNWYIQLLTNSRMNSRRIQKGKNCHTLSRNQTYTQCARENQLCFMLSWFVSRAMA